MSRNIDINLDSVSSVVIKRGEVFDFIKTGEDSDKVSLVESTEGYSITGGVKSNVSSKNINFVSGIINGVLYSSVSSEVKVDINLEVIIPDGFNVDLIANGKGKYHINMENKDSLKIQHKGTELFIVKKADIHKLISSGTGDVFVDLSTIHSDVSNTGTGDMTIEDSVVSGNIENSGTGLMNLTNVELHQEIKNSGTGDFRMNGTTEVSLTSVKNSGTGDIMFTSPIHKIENIKNSGTGDIKIQSIKSFDNLKSSGTGDVKIKNCETPGVVKNSGMGSISIPGVKSKGFSFGF